MCEGDVWVSTWQYCEASELTASGIRGIDNPNHYRHRTYQTRVNRCWGTFIALFLFFAFSAANVGHEPSFLGSMALTTACIAVAIVASATVFMLAYATTFAIIGIYAWLWDC